MKKERVERLIALRLSEKDFSELRDRAAEAGLCYATAARMMILQGLKEKFEGIKNEKR